MEPPWVKHPDIPAGSVGWRMGDGEEYYNQFYRWFSALPAAEQDAYVSSNEPPSGWRDLYTIIKRQPWA
jgi:hypothetical protein